MGADLGPNTLQLPIEQQFVFFDFAPSPRPHPFSFRKHEFKHGAKVDLSANSKK